MQLSSTKRITLGHLFQFFLISGLLTATRTESISAMTCIGSCAAIRTGNAPAICLICDTGRNRLIRLGVTQVDAGQQLTDNSTTI